MRGTRKKTAPLALSACPVRYRKHRGIRACEESGGRDAAVGGGGRRDAQALLDLMADPVFDPVREREEFLAAREKTEAILK